MSDQQFQVFLTSGIGLCGVMMIVSLLRSRSRGPSSYCLALAYLVMAVLLNGLRLKWHGPALALAGVCLVLCLVADFLVRAAQGQGKS
jgi:hypothetical protein